LKQYTWPFDKFDTVYAQYPGNEDEDVCAYKDSVKPKWDGPHNIWGGALVSDIWSDKNEWRAWIWELRSREKLKTSNSLVLWCCKDTDINELMDIVLAEQDEDKQKELKHLLATHVRGGLSDLTRRAWA